MNFISSEFIIFLLITILLFHALPSRFRKPLLLVASYIFYATWSLPFIAVILASTTIDYWASHLIQNAASQRKKKAVLACTIAINLFILGFFKYCNFFLENGHILAKWLHLNWPLPETLNIILPLGISFYTFEAISYLVDVYRGQPAARNWLDYNFYIMYFPHLISGPIIRFGELWPQCEKALETPRISRFIKGLELLLLGVAFKVLIADQAAGLANPFYAHPAQASSLAAYVAVLAFSLQIYFDFMGYTHIARGASLLFNIELPLNFNHPYHAANISNFWERWHISLSRWIREYLYFPLGGSKGTLLQTMLILTITMLICGAWHGAGWHFIAWGGFHGLLLSAYHAYRKFKNKLKNPLWNIIFQSRPYHLVSVAFTFLLVSFGWILFRVPQPGDVSIVMGKLSNLSELYREVQAAWGNPTTLLQLELLALMLACCFAGPIAVRLAENSYRPMPYWVKVQVCFFIGLLCWIAAHGAGTSFIYFQF